MASTFQVRIVTPTGIVFEGEVEQVTAVGPLGEFGVLAEHINFITSLVPGVLEARLPSGESKHWIVSGGLAEVKDGVMTVLASSAELPERVDASAAATASRRLPSRPARTDPFSSQRCSAKNRNLEFGLQKKELLALACRVEAGE